MASDVGIRTWLLSCSLVGHRRFSEVCQRVTRLKRGFVRDVGTNVHGSNKMSTGMCRPVVWLVPTLLRNLMPSSSVWDVVVEGPSEMTLLMYQTRGCHNPKATNNKYPCRHTHTYNTGLLKKMDGI